MILAEHTILSEIRRRMVGHNTPFVVSLDGRSGVGKSTLASSIANEVGGTVIGGDDFFAGGPDAEWDARTIEAKVADVIDWRRLRAEALVPLLAGRTARWYPFDFKTGIGLAKHTVTRAPSSVVIDLIDLAVLIEAPDDVRRQRLIAREGKSFMDAWHARWDAAEMHYFTSVRQPSSFDLVVTTG